MFIVEQSWAPLPHISGFSWRHLMTERPTDLTRFRPIRQPRRSLLSARKFALMASVVAGLGVAAYGFSPSR